MRVKKILLIVPLLCCQLLFGQKNDTSVYRFRQAENELKALQKPAFLSRNESERIEANKRFIAIWDGIVSNPDILDYPFDSLKEISILVPENKKFKLITWNLPKNDGTHAFFGYLLVNNSKRVKTGFLKHSTINAYESFKLLDRSVSVKAPETYVGTPDKWFGMLYTQLIDCGEYFTLIGWDGNDKLTQRKFIDVLYFKTDGSPVFGKDVFKFPKKNPRRLMFEYSSEVSMSVKYNEKKKQIIYSHLASKAEGTLLNGQFQYYGPDGSFDALERKKDKWVSVEDVDARNEKNKNDNADKPDPKKQTPVYKPK
ncbi:MAG: hypothetical protein IT236_05465 [Bacteroidia bacterium]|nr:hypothetical protein [Bacteroidia bacterium]